MPSLHNHSTPDLNVYIVGVAKLQTRYIVDLEQGGTSRPNAEKSGSWAEVESPMDGDFREQDFRTGFVHQPGGLKQHPALVLNADYRPLSYYPLSLWPWQDAIKAVYMDRVDIVAEYDTYVHSPSTQIKIPSVVVLRDYVKPVKRVAFTRFNLFLRDEFCCQYCGSRGDLTFDHVVPRAAGGVTSWENVVAACSPCNLKKGSKSLQNTNMHLRKPPRQPRAEELRNMGRKFPPNYLHDSWVDFLYWDAELDA